jgi:hypothetical protein
MDQQPGLIVEIPQPRSWDRPLVTVPAFAVLALIGGFFPSFSLMANLYVVVLGGVLMWFGLSGRVARTPSPRRLTRTAAWWLLPAGIFVAIELTDFVLGSTTPHPTLSVLLAGPLEGYTFRSVVYFIWLAGFWGLVRR